MTVTGLHRIGLVSDKTLCHFDSSCLKQQKKPISKKRGRLQAS
jgi:hypothetical protein